MTTAIRLKVGSLVKGNVDGRLGTVTAIQSVNGSPHIQTTKHEVGGFAEEFSVVINWKQVRQLNAEVDARVAEFRGGQK